MSDANPNHQPIQGIPAYIRDRITDIVADDHPDTIAERTGIDLARITRILDGDIPDGYELMAFEAAYKQPIWPRRRPAQPDTTA